MKQRVAVFLNAIEPLFLPQKKQRHVWGIVLAGSALEEYAKVSCSFPLIALTNTTSAPIAAFEEAIDHTDLTAQLKKFHITAVVVPHRSSEKISLWAHRHEITLLGTPQTMQTSLEDKIHFDTLLRKHDISVPVLITQKNIARYHKKYVVVQESDSFGGFGTRICLGKDVVPRSLSSKKILVRAYQSGMPCGVSIFLDNNANYFCSAVRRQCFTLEHGKPKKFIGVQWIPTNSFSKKTCSSINEMLKKLVLLLRAEKFVGIANIDFLITTSGVSVLECNPRFSSATPQIVLHPTLTHHADPWAFLINAFTKKKNMPLHAAELPKSTYSGALLDVDVSSRTTINGDVPLGVYTIKDISPLFLFHELPIRAHLAKDDTVCTILSDTPLFSQRGTYSAYARTILRACLDMFSVANNR